MQIGGRLLIASMCTNHYDWPIRNREHQSYHIYYTRLQQVLSFDVLSTNLKKLFKSAGPNPFCWAKLGCFYFSSYNFNVQSHILSTAGVALRAHQPTQPYLGLYQCLSHLTSLEARTPAPFRVHSTMEQIAFDGKLAVGFEVWTLEQMKQWPEYPTNLMMIDTNTRLWWVLVVLVKKMTLSTTFIKPWLYKFWGFCSSYQKM